MALCALVPLWASDNVLAGREGPFTRMGIGSRAQAMGNAQVALCEPTTVAAYWNPAMAVMIPGKQTLSTSYRFMSLGRRQGHVSFQTLVPPRMALGFALLYHGDRDIPIYNDDGTKVYTGGFLSVAMHICLAYKVNRRFSLGINTTIYSSSLTAGDNELDQTSTYALPNLDLSAYYALRKDLSLGLNIKHLASAMKWEAPLLGSDYKASIENTLPVNIKAGIAYRRSLYGRACAAAYDAGIFLVPDDSRNASWTSKLRNGSRVVEHHAGIECFVTPEFPVRLGFATNEGFSMGAGFHFRNGEFSNSKIDYVFSLEPNGSGINNGLSWTMTW